jgi:hypothetical protein
MKYPIINGEMPRIEPISEYHVVNARGMVIHIYDDYQLARDRFASFGNGCHLVQVTKRFTILETKKPIEVVTSSAAKARAHRERGDNVTFIPLTKVG